MILQKEESKESSHSAKEEKKEEKKGEKVKEAEIKKYNESYPSITHS